MDPIGPRRSPAAHSPTTTKKTDASSPAQKPVGGGGAAKPSLYGDGDSFERSGSGELAGSMTKGASAGAVGPGSGQPIQAKVKKLGSTGAQFEFSRPLTHDQAAQVLFQGGKVPDGAQLVPGKDANTWVLKTPDTETLQATLGKMNSRTETVDYGTPGEFVMSWTGGPNVVSTGPRRLDLKNDFGFVITKNYELDQGKIPERHVKSMVGKGIGYEVAFDKPMTKKEVMEKLFNQDQFEKGDVKAVPVGTPPAMVWQLEIVGPDALGAVKHPLSRAFNDANANAPKSMSPGIPAGMKTHFENKTVPQDAKHFPPSTYVWEQEGHIAHVTTDGKGYYQHESTALHPVEEKFNNTIRYFMLEKGMAPREGWQAFSKHWDEIHRDIVMAFMGALAGGRMPGRSPGNAVKVATPTTRRPVVKQPNVKTPTVRTGNTLPGNPPPAPKVAGGGTAPKTQPDVGKTMTADPARARTQSPTTQPDHGKTLTGDPARARTQTGPNQGAGQTVDSTGGGAAPPNANRPHKPGEVLVGTPVAPANRLPADMKITVKTPSGPKNMTVGDYRQRHAQAEKWMSQQMQKYQNSPGAQKGALPPNHADLSKQAQEKFGLDPDWQSIGNPYTHGRL